MTDDATVGERIAYYRMGDAVDAITQAQHVDTTALPGHLSERRASHLITVGWAHHLRRRDDEALAALVAARAAAPEQLLFTNRVRSMLTQMLRRDRRGRRDLREMADFVGVE